MSKNKKYQKQTFLYRGIEFQYKIQASSLRKFESETGIDCEKANSRVKDGTFMLLYYCTCWKGFFVSLETFIKDCRTGKVNFRPGAREYGSLGIYKLFARKLHEYHFNGDI